MKIDWNMFPMKLHYFVRFAGTGPLTPFLPVIARQKGVPAEVVGLIWTVLPFISPLIKTSEGAIADWLKAHRLVFLGGLIVMTTSLTGLYWAPDMPVSGCPNSTLDDAPQDLTRTYGRNLIHNQSAVLGDSAGSQDGEYRTILSGNDTVTNLSPVTAGTLQCSPSEHNTENASVGELAGHYEFWILFVCLFLQYFGHITVIVMQETVCLQMLGKARHKYGEQRLWGTLGWGLSAVVSGALVDWYSAGSHKKDYLPAHVITAVFLLADLVVVARLKFSIPDKMSAAAVHGALWQPHVLLILVTAAVIGATCGMLWTFQLLLVEDVALLWHSQFPHLKLLLGLIMGVQCFLAETPFFFLAGRIIRRLGHVHAFFLSLMGFAVRLSVYSTITNPWWFLPADILHGISFGIAYPSIISYANSVSPKGAAATTQAIFGAAFYCGSGVGSLVGGRLFKAMGGWWAFLSVGVFDGMYGLAFLSVHTLISRRRLHTAPQDEADRATGEERGREGVAMEEVDFEELRLVEEVAKEPQEVSEEEREGEAIGGEADFEEVQLVDTPRVPQDNPEARSQKT